MKSICYIESSLFTENVLKLLKLFY